LVLPRAEPAPVLAAQRTQQELARAHGGIQPVAPAGGGGRLRQRRQHEPVPLGQDLVVEPRARPLLTGGEEPWPGLLDAGRTGEIDVSRAARMDAVQDGAALEVAARRHAVERNDLARQLPVAVERRHDLVRGPDVETTLLAVAVGVLGREEPSARVAQVPQHVRHRLVQHLPVAIVAQDLPGVQVGACQQGLVVEHLLEVGHQPGGVDRVAGEAAAQMVVDPARGHGVERRLHHPLDVGIRGRPARQGPHQQVEAHRLRELGGTAEAASSVVVLLAESLDRGLEGVDAG
jgi:hypothetical protein